LPGKKADFIPVISASAIVIYCPTRLSIKSLLYRVSETSKHRAGRETD